MFEYTGWMRYPKSLIRTLFLLINERPKLLFVQNPSMVLAAFVCMYKILISTFVVVDRHTTFLLSEKRINIGLIIYKFLNNFTIKYANITIVTNDYLAQLVDSLYGNSFVLPDKLPIYKYYKTIKLEKGKKILYITSFNNDEPVKEVLMAMSFLKNDNIFMYVSGNYKKLEKNIYNKSPYNVYFTGYLSDDKFISLLHSVDVVMVLTKADYCMLCGCYEAVSANKPLITSNKNVLREYFIGAKFVDNNPVSISEGIVDVFNSIDLYENRILKLKESIKLSWECKSKILENKFSDLSL